MYKRQGDSGAVATVTMSLTHNDALTEDSAEADAEPDVVVEYVAHEESGTVQSVSYTQLDVYKRQPWRRPG